MFAQKMFRSVLVGQQQQSQDRHQRFIANLIIWGTFTLFSVVPAIMFLIFIAPAIGIICGYLALLASSIYTAAMIIRLRKRGIITKGQSVLHIILQLIFVTDVISSILLVKQLARKAK